MGFGTALAAPQYTKLRSSSYASETLISLFSNRVVFAGQLDDPDISRNLSWAEFIYNNVTVGAYTDVEVDQVLIISKTSDIKQGRFYRIRKAPTNSIIYCNESSANYAIGAYFWVIDSYFPQQRLSRPSTSDPTTAVELVDFDVAYKGLPPNVIGIKLGYVDYLDGTGVMRRGFDASQSKPVEPGTTITGYQYTFAAGTYSVAAGALNTALCIIDFTVAGEQWGQLDITLSDGQVWTRHFGIKVHDPATYPPDTGFDEQAAISVSDLQQGYTLTVPAFTGVDAVLPNTFAIAWRNNEQYGGVQGGLFGGGSAAITAKACTTNTATLTAPGHPFQAGQTVIVAGVGAPFDGTWIISATTSTTFSYLFKTVQTPVSTTSITALAVVNPQNVDFVGWLQSETDPVQSDANASVVSTANFTFTGIGPRLQRMANQLLGFQMMATPTLWGQFVNLTPKEPIFSYLCRYTTVGNLVDIVFDPFGFTPYLVPDNNSQGQNVLDVIRGVSGGGAGLAQQVCANVEYDPSGAIGIFFDIGYLDTFFRADLTKLGDFDAQDGLAVTKMSDPNPTIGKVDANGGYYNPASKQFTVWQSRAPGHAEDEGSGTDTLGNQILRSDTSASGTKLELRQRAGNRFIIDNDTTSMDVDWPDGYTCLLQASRSQYITLTLDTTLAGPNGVNRIICDTSTGWLIASASYQQAENGTRVIRTHLVIVTDVGDPGDDTTPNIPPNSIPPSVPDLGLPAFSFDDPALVFPDSGSTSDAVAPAQLTPPPGQAIQGKGQELIVWSPTEAFFLRNFIALTRPRANDITPSDLGVYSIKQIAADPFSNFTTQVGGDLLASDGVNSAIWNAPSVLPTVPVWTRGADIAGVYNVIRAAMVAGGVFAYTPVGGPGTTTITYDFTLRDYGFSAQQEVIHSGGGWVAGVGWTPWDEQDTSPSANWHRHLYIYKPGVSFVGVTQIVATYTVTRGTNFAGDFDAIEGNSSIIEQINVPLPSGTNITLTYTGSINLTEVGFNSYVSGASTSGGLTGSETLTKLVITLATGTGAVVAYSSDYGASWAAINSVGATPGSVGGMDCQRSGKVSYAAAAGKVRKATTLGGTYSDWYAVPSAANPVCLIIPYFRRNSTTLNTSVSDPDVLCACDNGKLYWIDGATATATDITPSGITAFDNPNCVTVSYGHHLAVFGKVSGTYHLFTSTNGGTSWTDRGTITSPGFIRDRRNDASAVGSGTNKGQLYLVQGSTPVVDYSSFWAAGSGSPPDAGMWPRNMPASGIIGLETIY